MAFTTEAHPVKSDAAERPRRGEIVALLLCATGVLVLLCLASYNPNDTSMMAAGGNAESANLIGAVGANIAAVLLQFFGIVSFALPVALFFAAWRRFRTGSVRASFNRIAGVALMLIAAAALFALSGLPLLADRSYQPGGIVGTLVALTFAGWFNMVGAAVLLVALLGVGLLIATDFSFAGFYKHLASDERRFVFFRTLPTRFQAWRERRLDAARERAARRRLAQEEAALAVADRNASSEDAAGGRGIQKTAAERVADFMRETEPGNAVATRGAANAIKRAAQTEAPTAHDPHAPATSEGDTTPLTPSATRPRPLVSPAAIAASQSSSAVRGATTPKRDAALQNGDEEVEEMIRTAAVVRTDLQDAPEAASLVASVGTSSVKSTPRRQPEAVTLDYKLPDPLFLHEPAPRREQADDELLALARRVAEKCKEFNVTGSIEHICPGPVVTTYEFKPDPGVKYSRVTGLVDDLCLALKAESVRIDRVPGKAHVGIEVPNPEREVIFMREVLESRAYKESPSPLTLALGKTIDGLNYVADLAKMPHLLIAGATGTGKSVCLNSLIVSILYKASPDEVKFIMVDPKRLELGLYADIPHLATPIITEPKRAANALKWAVAEMEKRYRDLAKWTVRNIDGYNTEVRRRNLVEEFDEEGNPHKTLPYLVIIIDELADLMMVSGHEVEEAITRLAQMARAVGIHLVLATQRPSVDVITGLIKANFPSRISFRVSSKVDSRTILDTNGAEGLLGRGDMLFLPPGTSRLVRVHGAYLDETEVAQIVAHIKAQGQPAYDETITKSEEEADGDGATGGERDEVYDQALRICVEMKRASTSVLQRRLRIGYGRAAAILDAMERDGLIGPADGSRPRPVLGRAFETVSHWDDLAASNGEE